MGAANGPVFTVSKGHGDGGTSNEHGAAQSSEATPVNLHVYNVGSGAELKTLNRVLRPLGTGVFHCGVEVFGKEWSFRGTEVGTGVFWCKPQCCSAHTFVETVYMGSTRFSHEQVLRLVAYMALDWYGGAYDALERNCCHFSKELCELLGLMDMPKWILSAAEAGAAIAKTSQYLTNYARAFSPIATAPKGSLKSPTCDDVVYDEDGPRWPAYTTADLHDHNQGRRDPRSRYIKPPKEDFCLDCCSFTACALEGAAMFCPKVDECDCCGLGEDPINLDIMHEEYLNADVLFNEKKDTKIKL